MESGLGYDSYLAEGTVDNNLVPVVPDRLAVFSGSVVVSPPIVH